MDPRWAYVGDDAADPWEEDDEVEEEDLFFFVGQVFNNR